MTGIVKFFNDAKGYGFIVNDDDKKDVFFHRTGLNNDVKQNDKVEFDLKEGKKGLEACNIDLI